MYGQISTVAFAGIEARAVEVQVRLTPGKRLFHIVGLPDKAVAESGERVRNALHAIGLSMPLKRLTVNLAPADLPKEGSHYDLAILLGILVAIQSVSRDAIANFAAFGELALDGSIRAVPGVLPAAIGANAMGKGLICAAQCGPEAAWAGEHIDILAAPHLLSLINHFRGTQLLSRPKPNLEHRPPSSLDLKDVRGQESAKRALEVAAAGGHNLLMSGPPGSGKSMLAARLPTILPPLSTEEMLEVSMVHSLAGELLGGKLCVDRPFRAPHHSASMPSLVGGGSRPKPGEASLAHMGVLFLDELPEFLPNVLDALRQPLESGEIIIARANHRICYPARFQLVGAMNPCKCGGGNPGESCRRGPRCATDYQARISGPFLDRIDLNVEMPAVSASDLSLPAAREGSAEVRARVTAARERQRQRFKEAGYPNVRTNAECSGQLLDRVAMPDDAGLALMRQAANTLNLSARGYHRVLKVARTIADLDGVETTAKSHIAEALSYRGDKTRPGQAAA